MVGIANNYVKSIGAEFLDSCH